MHGFHVRTEFLFFLCVHVPGIPLNKSLYSVSYLLVTSAASGITFCILYILVSLLTINELKKHVS